MTHPRDAAELEALRRRLYAPDAPPEAAAEYAARAREFALEAAASANVRAPSGTPAPAAREFALESGESANVRAQPVAPRPARVRRGPLIAAAALVAVAVVAGVLAVGGSPHPAPSATPAPAAPAATAPTVLSPPPVPGKVLATMTSDSRAVSTRLDARGSSVYLAALCTGDGTITFRIGTEPPTVIACTRGMPALVLVTSRTRLRGFVLSTQSDGAPRWALTVAALNMTPPLS